MTGTICLMACACLKSTAVRQSSRLGFSGVCRMERQALRFGIFAASKLGNAIAYCRTEEDAERIARLLNREEWHSEHNH